MKLKYLMIAVFLAIQTNAYAVQGFSRACNLLSIKNQYPLNHQVVFSFFSLAGMSLSDRNMLRYATDSELATYWVNESFTADTVSIPRYYLFAKNIVRSKPIAVVGAGTAGTFVQNFESSSWSSFELDPTKLPNDVLIMLQNRHLGFFARAGHSAIIQKFTDKNVRYEVEAQHAYYFPIEQISRFIPKSFARDCNFNWSWAWL